MAACLAVACLLRQHLRPRQAAHREVANQDNQANRDNQANQDNRANPVAECRCRAAAKKAAVPENRVARARSAAFLEMIRKECRHHRVRVVLEALRALNLKGHPAKVMKAARMTAMAIRQANAATRVRFQAALVAWERLANVSAAAARRRQMPRLQMLQ